jgi:hypothetical protein
VREVDLEFDPRTRTLKIFYSRKNSNVQVADDAALNALLMSLYSPNHQYDPAPPGPPKRPFDSNLSLNNDRGRYIIFKLKDGLNWQFAREGWPITIGEQGENYFFDAFRIDADGVADRGDDKQLRRDGCMIAYVIASGDAAIKDGGAYCHPINLHVDLIGEVLPDSGPPAQKCYLPIIIDPDVRYPGGTDP